MVPGFFGLFELIFPLMFLLVFGMVIFVMISNLRQWNKNNHSPRLTVDATVVTKRTSVSHHHHDGAGGVGYYATFQVESGDRMELNLSGQEYGLLAEGDRGKLTFQGTRYLGFEREL